MSRRPRGTQRIWSSSSHEVLHRAVQCGAAALLVSGALIAVPATIAQTSDLSASSNAAGHSHEAERRPPSANDAPTASDAGISRWSKLSRVLTLRDYNTRVVLIGTLMLGVAAGMVGTFMLLRKRALVGDVVSHAALPGIAGAFLAMEIIRPGSGKSIPALLLGALLAGLLAMVGVIAIRRLTRLKDDAALAIVLSVFFGCGVALFTVVQSVPTGNQAGLQGFIFGKTASMVAADVTLIGQAALATVVLCALLFKEFTLLCFDEQYAGSQGWPTVVLDMVLMTLVGVVTVIGLQSVGLLLVVALLIIPPAAARFWTNRLKPMTMIAAAIGGASATGGAIISAMFPQVAAGAVIVLTAAALFALSLIFSPQSGLVRRIWERRHLVREVDRQHLLRALYELIEVELARFGKVPTDEPPNIDTTIDQLLAVRSWSPRRLRTLLSRAISDGELDASSSDRLRMTSEGWAEARRIARNHRLWEMYLISHADMAVERVDRYADMIEHVLEPDLLAELESQLAAQQPATQPVPPSPHDIETELPAPSAAELLNRADGQSSAP